MSEPGRCADVGDWNPTRCVVCDKDLGVRQQAWRLEMLGGRASACYSHSINTIAAATMPNMRLESDVDLDDPDAPVEDYTTWRRVDADVTYGSGIPRPIADPEDFDKEDVSVTGDPVFVWCAVCNVGLGRRRPWRFVPTMSLSGRVAVCNSHTAEEIRGAVGPDRSTDSRKALQASTAKVDPVLHLALTWAKAGWLTIEGDWRNQRVHRNGRQVSDLTELAINGMHETYVTMARYGRIQLTDAGVELLAQWDAQVMDGS